MDVFDDGGDEKGLKNYEDHLIELGVIAAMDDDTYLEWMRRQLETPEETTARHEARKARHKEWHRTTPGIFGCCIKLAMSGF